MSTQGSTVSILVDSRNRPLINSLRGEFRGGKGLGTSWTVASLYLTLGTVPSYPKQCLPLCWHSRWIWGKVAVGRAFLMVASLEKGEGTIQETPQSSSTCLRLFCLLWSWLAPVLVLEGVLWVFPGAWDSAPSQQCPGSFALHCHGLAKPKEGEPAYGLASWSSKRASLLATAQRRQTLPSADVKQKMLFCVNVWFSAANGNSLWL